jgi:hypothetical protein
LKTLKGTRILTLRNLSKQLKDELRIPYREKQKMMMMMTTARSCWRRHSSSAGARRERERERERMCVIFTWCQHSWSDFDYVQWTMDLASYINFISIAQKRFEHEHRIQICLNWNSTEYPSLQSSGKKQIAQTHTYAD